MDEKYSDLVERLLCELRKFYVYYGGDFLDFNREPIVREVLAAIGKPNHRMTADGLKEVATIGNPAFRRAG